jgi:hypothetical protein
MAVEPTSETLMVLSVVL